jgi:hypothetical protein
MRAPSRHLPSLRQLLAAGVIALVVVPLLLPLLASLPLLDALRTARGRLEALGPAPADLDAELRLLDDLDGLTRQLTEDQLGLVGGLVAGSRVRAARAARLEALGRDVIAPAHRALAEVLRSGEDWREQRDRLAAYLMVAHQGPRDRRAREILGPLVLVHLRTHTHRPESALHDLVDDLLDPAKNRITAVPAPSIDASLVRSVEAALAAAPLAERIASATEGWVATTRYAGDGELQYPPLTLEWILARGPRGILRHRSEPGVAVPGPHTGWGRAGVLARLAELEKEFRDDDWLVPPLPWDADGGLAAALRRAHDAHAERQKEAWLAFLGDLTVAVPRSLEEAADLLHVLAQPEGPYPRLLRQIRAALSPQAWDPDGFAPGKRRGEPRALPCEGGPHVTLPWDAKPPCSPRMYDPIARERSAEQWWAGVAGTADPPLRAALGPMLALGAQGDEPFARTPLGRWAGHLDVLRLWLRHIEEDRRSGEPHPHGARHFLEARAAARRDTEALLGALDEPTRRIWGPLLLEPLAIGPELP